MNTPAIVKTWGRLAALGVGLMAAVSVQAQAQQPVQGGTVYTCVDKVGRRITADRPIPECFDREQRVLDNTGTERRRVGPVLTENERAAQEVQRKKEAEQRARVAEERRRERSLVARFPDEATHNVERQAALAMVDDQIVLAQSRITQLGGERKAIDRELEFYKGDVNKAPPKVQRRVTEHAENLEEQERLIMTQQQEKRRLGHRYDEELAKLKQLWAADRAVLIPGTPAAPPASAPR